MNMNEEMNKNEKKMNIDEDSFSSLWLIVGGIEWNLSIITEQLHDWQTDPSVVLQYHLGVCVSALPDGKCWSIVPEA